MSDFINFLNFQNNKISPNEKGEPVPDKAVFHVTNIDGTVNPVKNPLNSTITIKPFLTGEKFDFLREAFLMSNEKGMSLHCCYFKYNGLDSSVQDLESNDPEWEKLFNPRIGTLLLPKEFQYVSYIVVENNVTFNETNFSPPRTKYLFTPVIAQLRGDENSSNVIDLFHLCKHEATRPAVIEGHCLKPFTSSLEQPFHLFYYKGSLLLPEKRQEVDGEFYLIPLMLSDGLIIYYAIEIGNKDLKPFQERIDEFYNKSKNALYLVVEQNLAYNDKKSIFVCSLVDYYPK
jgi:hypothetical protein